MENKKKKTIFIIMGIMAVVLTIIGSTYAYWTLNKSQNDSNVIEAACINFELDGENALAVDDAWPISDFEGTKLEGYTFTVTNNCPDPIDYQISLDSMKMTDGTKYLQDSAVNVQLDYSYFHSYASLENNSLINLASEPTLRNSKVITMDTVLGNATNTHKLRLWIDDQSDLDLNQSGNFQGRVSISGGQGIVKEYTADNCFTFNAAGSITAYDVACGGTDVVIPYEINDVPVTGIGTAFSEKGLTSLEIPRTVTTINRNAFARNSIGNNLVLHDGLISIGITAFVGDISESFVVSPNITFLMIPSTVTDIKSYAFGNNSIDYLKIPNTVTTLMTSSFVRAGLTQLELGTGATSLAAVFANNSIKEIVIPDTITTLNNTFIDNPLEKVTIGSGLTTISGATFGISGSQLGGLDVYTLKSIFLPANVTTVSDLAFEGATAATTIYVENEQGEMTDTAGLVTNNHAVIVYGATNPTN